jgi:hypothetical protein
MKELEDHSWFPPVLRNFQTEFIGFVVANFNVYDDFIQHLKSLSLPVQSMTDLCSGSGEPAISIFRKSICFSHLYLSDKFPTDFRRCWCSQKKHHAFVVCLPAGRQVVKWPCSRARHQQRVL